MDSFPNELIDAIIDNLPRSSLYSTSLVARRWRIRSQQRILDSITFSSRYKVDRWYSDIQRGTNRIASYVRSAEFHRIDSWSEPELCGRVLKGFRSLTTLNMYRCAVPDELLRQISRGECGRGITTLSIWFPGWELPRKTSLILSLPNLKRLTVQSDGTIPREQSSAPITLQRRSLDMLELHSIANEFAETLIQAQLTSRYIRLGGAISSVYRFIAISSETLVSLMLKGL